MPYIAATAYASRQRFVEYYMGSLLDLYIEFGQITDAIT
jgi:hypothetical protein